MAIVTGQLTVNSTPIAVNAPNVMPLRIHIHNNDNTSNLIVGSEGLTVSNGLMLPKLDSLDLTLNPMEVIYLLSSGSPIQASYIVQSE